MSTPAIEFRGLSKNYRSGFWGRATPAVQSLSLQVPQGCIYGFLGANGAGKTTCIKILMGLLIASEGAARIFGLSPGSTEVKLRIGYLPERPYFHDGMDADAFLNFHRRLFGRLPTARRLQTNDELLALVGLSSAGDKPLRTFSKGMLQRVGIAQTLVNDPDLIVLDEPMSGLDPVGRREMREIIHRLHELGKTVFFSSHILSDVEELCDRIAFLDKGSLRHEGALSELLRSSGQGYDLTFAAAKGDAPASSRKVFCANQTELRAAIEAAWVGGEELLACARRQPSLEDFLFGAQGRAK